MNKLFHRIKLLYICSKFSESFNIKHIKDSQLYKLLSDEFATDIKYNNDITRVILKRLGVRLEIYKTHLSKEYVTVYINRNTIYQTFENTININPKKILTFDNIQSIYNEQSEYEKSKVEKDEITQKEIDSNLDRFRDYSTISHERYYHINTIYIISKYENLSELISDVEVFTSLYPEYESNIRVSKIDLYLNNLTKKFEMSDDSTITCVLTQNIKYELESFKTYVDVY